MTLSSKAGFAQVVAALPTIFTDTGELDLRGCEAVMCRAREAGTQHFLVAGTSGEFVTLTDEERTSLFEMAVGVAGSNGIIAHLGGASTRQSRTLARSAADAGVRRFALLTPFYYQVSVETTSAHFEEIVDVNPGLEHIGYHFPARTGAVLTSSDLARIAVGCNLTGWKLSTPGVGDVAELISNTRTELRVWTGNDAMLPEAAALGAAGTVSGVLPALPDLFLEQARRLHGSSSSETELDGPVREVVSTLGTSIAHVKHALQMQGVIHSDYCRAPLTALSVTDRSRIGDTLRKYNGSVVS